MQQSVFEAASIGIVCSIEIDIEKEIDIHIAYVCSYELILRSGQNDVESVRYHTLLVRIV